MKKTILFLCAVISSISLYSCNGLKPEFTFDLEITGQVNDAKTNIASTFEGKVSNSDLVVEKRMGEVQPMLTADGVPTEASVDANEWLDDYFNQNFRALTSEQTKYNVHIVGFVHEKSTGLTFSINKTYKNADSLFVK